MSDFLSLEEENFLVSSSIATVAVVINDLLVFLFRGNARDREMEAFTFPRLYFSWLNISMEILYGKLETPVTYFPFVTCRFSFLRQIEKYFHTEISTDGMETE